MPREKTVGVSLRDGVMEVAFEQWTERGMTQVSSNVNPTLQGDSIGQKSRIDRVQREFSEFRW